MARHRRWFGPAAALAALAACGALWGGPGRALAAAPVEYRPDPGASRIQVHVDKKGLLSGLAHDHHFAATAWRATARLDPASGAPGAIDVVVEAGSLRDQQPALSAGDREKVDRQAAQSLEALHYPEVRFTGDGPLRPAEGAAPAGADGALSGLLDGRLALHGRERPVAVPLRAEREGDGWRVRGTFSLRQSDFGIEPFSGFLGTISVHDEVRIELDLLLIPAG